MNASRLEGWRQALIDGLVDEFQVQFPQHEVFSDLSDPSACVYSHNPHDYRYAHVYVMKSCFQVRCYGSGPPGEDNVRIRRVEFMEPESIAEIVGLLRDHFGAGSTRN